MMRRSAHGCRCGTCRELVAGVIASQLAQLAPDVRPEVLRAAAALVAKFEARRRKAAANA